MSNVISFPTKAVSDWAIIERSMRDALEKRNTPQAVRDRLIPILKTFYQSLDPDLNFTLQVEYPAVLSVEAGSALLNKVGTQIGALTSERMKAFTNKLFIERMHRELDICEELGML